MSSTFFATCGNSSDTSIPHWPYFLNDHGDGIRPPGCPCETTTSPLPVIASPCRFSKLRLRIERIHLAHAAVAEDRDHRFRFRREVRRLRRQRRLHRQSAKHLS